MIIKYIQHLNDHLNESHAPKFNEQFIIFGHKLKRNLKFRNIPVIISMCTFFHPLLIKPKETAYKSYQKSPFSIPVRLKTNNQTNKIIKMWSFIWNSFWIHFRTKNKGFSITIRTSSRKPKWLHVHINERKNRKTRTRR